MAIPSLYNRRQRSLYEEDDKDLDAYSATELDNENMPADDKYESVLEFIKILEGYKLRLRELHWAADCNAMHKLTDDCISSITSYEDTIAEDLMGMDNSTIGVGMLIPIITKTTDFKSLLAELVNKTIELKSLLKDDDNYSGLCNVLDDMIHNVRVTNYLERFN